MRVSFSDWYGRNFDLLVQNLKKEGIDTSVLEALFPALEISAIRHFDSRELSIINKLKWVYYLLVKKDEDYSIEQSDGEPYDVILWPSQLKHYKLQLPYYYQLKKQNIKVGFISCTNSIQNEFVNDNVSHVQIKVRNKNTNRFHVLLQNLKIIKRTRGFDPYLLGKRKIFFHRIISDTLTFRIPCDKTIAIYNLLKIKPKMVFFGYTFSTVALAIDKKCLEDNILTASHQAGRLSYYLFKYSSVNIYYGYGKEVSNNILKVTDKVEPVEVGSLKIEITENSPDKDEVQKLISEILLRFKYLGLVAFSGPGLSVSVHGHMRNLTALLKAVMLNPEIYFIIKFHGKDDLDYYSKFKNCENVLIIDQNHPFYKYDIMHLIKCCDFLISGGSTTLIEAAYWSKPAISIDALKELRNIELLNERFIYKCHDFYGLNNSIHSAIQKDDEYSEKVLLMKKFSDYCFKNDVIPPSELIALDVVRRLGKGKI